MENPLNQLACKIKLPDSDNSIAIGCFKLLEIDVYGILIPDTNYINSRSILKKLKLDDTLIPFEIKKRFNQSTPFAPFIFSKVENFSMLSREVAQLECNYDLEITAEFDYVDFENKVLKTSRIWNILQAKVNSDISNMLPGELIYSEKRDEFFMLMHATKDFAFLVDYKFTSLQDSNFTQKDTLPELKLFAEINSETKSSLNVLLQKYREPISTRFRKLVKSDNSRYFEQYKLAVAKSIIQAWGVDKFVQDLDILKIVENESTIDTSDNWLYQSLLDLDSTNEKDNDIYSKQFDWKYKNLRVETGHGFDGFKPHQKLLG